MNHPGRWTVLETGFWSLADQGAVSAGNFVTAVLLARALAPAEYGVYALLFALMLFMVGLHAALIAYGLSLDGAAATEAGLRPLAGGSLTLTAGLGMVLGAATGVVAVLFHRVTLAPSILLALLFWQLQETTRRALMSRLRHRDAVWGDALSYLGQAACIAYLFVENRLTLASTFEVMAATSAAAWFVQVAQLKLTLNDFCGGLRLVPKFWTVGRWMLLTNVAQGFIDQALLWFLALRGTAEVAAFQSVLNLLRAMNPVMFGIGSVLLPTVAAQQGNLAAGLHAARRYGLLGALILLPYFGAISIFPRLTLQLLYGPTSAYSGLQLEVRLLVVASTFIYATYMLGAYYNGLSRSYTVLRFQLIGSATALVGGFVLVTQARVLGASVAYGLAFAAQTAAYIWFLRRHTLSLVRPAASSTLSVTSSASPVEQP